ncbi:MAG TPA: MFS transporter [Smithellaceae bacterium]|nr:MFS transporter [Smithellaceae bacterium]
MFVTSFLGANMAVLGLLDGVGEAFVSISKALSGYLSDKIRKRKIFIWSGYLFGSLSRVGYAFAPAWQWLLPLKILDRSGKIRAAPRDAFVADISTEQNRGGNFGLMKAMDNLGAVCGIIICFLNKSVLQIFSFLPPCLLWPALFSFINTSEKIKLPNKSYTPVSPSKIWMPTLNYFFF